MPALNTYLERLLQGIIRAIFPVTLLVAICVFVLLLSGRIDMISSYHHDLGGVEPNVVYGIQRILDGQPLYSDPNQPPYAIIMYSPMYFHTVALAGKASGVNPDKPIEVYKISRSMALLFNILFIGFVGLILFRYFNVHLSVVIIICSLVFSYLRITDFGRPDSLYHLFCLMTLTSFLEFIKTKSATWWVLASILSIAGVFAKQSGLILPVIILFYLLFYESSLKKLAQTTGIMIFSFLLLWVLFSGDSYAFWQNVFQGVNNGVSWDWFQRRVLFFYLRELALFGGIALAISALFLIKPYSDSKKILAIASFGFFFFALLTSLKWGSMPSYFTPFIALGWMVLTVWYYSTHVDFLKRYQQGLFGLVALCCFAAEVPHKYQSYRFRENPTKYEQAKEVSNYLKNELSLQPSEQVLALVDKQFLMEQHFLNNFLFRNVILPTKDIFTCCAYPLKKYDYSLLETNADRGLVKYIIRNKGSKSPKFFKFQFKNFKKIVELKGYDIYKYQGKGKEQNKAPSTNI